MYQTIDRFDSRGLADMMAADASFRYANLPPVTGRENIFQFLEGFFKSIKGIQHSDLEYWYHDNNWFVTGNVAYTRHDTTVMKVPFSVILRMQEQLIREFLIFVDSSELYK